MKKVKSFFALLLAVIMTLALGTTAFAETAQTYSITVKNTNENISIAGNEYKAYEVFSATYDAAGHVTYYATEAFKNFTFTVNGTTYNTSSSDATTGLDALVDVLAKEENNSAVMDDFSEAIMAYISANNITTSYSATAANESATIAVPEAGYYVVTGEAYRADKTSEKVVTAYALTTAKPNAEVIVKADIPSVDKKIVEGEKELAANTASIGDTVNFKITSAVPNMTGYDKYFFVVNDTLSKGLTYDGDSTLTVKIGDATLVQGTDYTVESVVDNTAKTTALTIVFKNFIQYKDQADAAITITYSATVNQDADLSPVEGNPNTVTLTYSNNPNVTPTGKPGDEDVPGTGDATGVTPESKTVTYVTGLKLLKVDGKDTSKTLAGAKFSISGTTQKVVVVNEQIFKAVDSVAEGETAYYMLKDGTYTDQAAVEDKTSNDYNADKYDSTTQKYVLTNVISTENKEETFQATGYTNAQGILTFEGLNAGTYTITELIAPNGYNLLKNPITIEIKANATADGCTWTVTKDGTELTANTAYLYEFTVENNAGSELPSTGGIGTTIFYVVGSILVVGAGVLLISKKRMNG